MNPLNVLAIAKVAIHRAGVYVNQTNKMMSRRLCLAPSVSLTEHTAFVTKWAGLR